MTKGEMIKELEDEACKYFGILGQSKTEKDERIVRSRISLKSIVGYGRNTEETKSHQRTPETLLS